MTTFLYLLIAALIFGVIGYILASINCTGGKRYLNNTPIDPVTEDDGSCEDADIKASKVAEETAKAGEAQRLLDEAAAEKVKAEAEAAVKAAQEKAEKEAAVLAAAAIKAAQEKADTEKAEAEAKKEAEVVAATEVTTEEEAPAGAAPEGLLSAPRDGKKDNLTRIKGIGVKIDEALNGIGIYHFDQIAAWTEDNMAWADAALAFPGRAKRDDWVGQAALLAKGKETEFSQRVDKGEVASSKKG